MADVARRKCQMLQKENVRCCKKKMSDVARRKKRPHMYIPVLKLIKASNQKKTGLYGLNGQINQIVYRLLFIVLRLVLISVPALYTFISVSYNCDK